MFFRPLFFSLPISDPHCLRNAFSLCTFLLSKPRLGFTTTSRRPTHACTKACHLPCLPTSHLPSQPPTIFPANHQHHHHHLNHNTSSSLLFSDPSHSSFAFASASASASASTLRAVSLSSILFFSGRESSNSNTTVVSSITCADFFDSIGKSLALDSLLRKKRKE